MMHNESVDSLLNIAINGACFQCFTVCSQLFERIDKKSADLKPRIFFAYLNFYSVHRKFMKVGTSFSQSASQ